jgi:hypothetical protein
MPLPSATGWKGEGSDTSWSEHRPMSWQVKHTHATHKEKRRKPGQRDAAFSALLLLYSVMVPTEGLEPPHPKAHGPEPCASTNSATWALILQLHFYYKLLADKHPVVVPTEGLEPPHPKAHGPEPCASTNSATWALYSTAVCCFCDVAADLCYHIRLCRFAPD